MPEHAPKTIRRQDDDNIDSDLFLLTKADVKSMGRVSLRTVNNWISSGKLKPLRLSTQIVRFRRSDVEKLFEESAA